jgi:D-beta-D-heptose 7-phosphate kinase / D-beta-D-heptose 1-phosphate adenosyltransferase
MARPESAAHDLRALQDTHTLVVGDVMLDRYVTGETQRLSPEAPVPVVLETSTRLALGGAANVAANIVSLGARATLVGRVGDDPDGEAVLRILDSRGIGQRLGRVAGIPTTSKTRVVSGMQQLTRIDRETTHPTTADEAASALAVLDDFLLAGGSRAVVLADYAKGFLGAELIREIIDRADRAGVPVVADPKSTDLARYAGSTMVKPNLAEARRACPEPPSGLYLSDTSEEIAYLADAYLRLSGARNVVLSCSAGGVAVVGTQSPSLTRFPTNARQVADVSGAGDTLIAVSALGLAAGLDLRRTVEMANAAAGAVCEKAGTACLSATELLKLIANNLQPRLDVTNPKVLANRDEAADVGAQYRREDRRLVMANGCFDLLHAGHVKLLTQARQEGDALMVALNTDASVRSLKGAGRPVQSEADRCEIMAALECVDFVVLFEEETPLNLILAVRPSVLVKGDDYDADSVVGASEMQAWGGKVVLASRLKGRSTTRLIDRSET